MNMFAEATGVHADVTTAKRLAWEHACLHGIPIFSSTAEEHWSQLSRREQQFWVSCTSSALMAIERVRGVVRTAVVALEMRGACQRAEEIRNQEWRDRIYFDRIAREKLRQE